jgi:hypothetical protein
MGWTKPRTTSATGNIYFASPEKYLDRQLKPGLVRLRGEETSAVREVTVGGRPGKAFTRDTFDFFPPDSLDTKEIPVRREHFVIPHRDGFIVILFSAPTKSHTRWRPVLEHLLETTQL